MVRVFAVVAVAVLTGCVTVSPEAEKVQVHSQVSTLLDSCKKLGPVTGSGSRAIAYRHAVETAKVKLREAAYHAGGDTVAIVNQDTHLGEVRLQGVALKCY